MAGEEKVDSRPFSLVASEMQQALEESQTTAPGLLPGGVSTSGSSTVEKPAGEKANSRSRSPLSEQKDRDTRGRTLDDRRAPACNALPSSGAASWMLASAGANPPVNPLSLLPLEDAAQSLQQLKQNDLTALSKGDLVGLIGAMTNLMNTACQSMQAVQSQSSMYLQPQAQPQRAAQVEEQHSHNDDEAPDGKRVPKAIGEEMDKFIREIEKNIFTLVKSKRRIKTLDDELEVFGRDQYPDTVRSFNPPKFPEVDNDFPAAESQDHKLDVTIKKGSSYGEAMIQVHRQAHKFCKELERDFLKERCAHAQSVSTRDHFRTLYRGIDKSDVFVRSGLNDNVKFSDEDMDDRGEKAWKQMWIRIRRDLEKLEKQAQAKDDSDKANASSIANKRPETLVRTWLHAEIDAKLRNSAGGSSTPEEGDDDEPMETNAERRKRERKEAAAAAKMEQERLHETSIVIDALGKGKKGKDKGKGKGKDAKGKGKGKDSKAKGKGQGNVWSPVEPSPQGYNASMKGKGKGKGKKAKGKGKGKQFWPKKKKTKHTRGAW